MLLTVLTKEKQQMTKAGELLMHVKLGLLWTLSTRHTASEPTVP